MPDRTIPLLQVKQASVSTRAGTDPDDLDVCTEAHGHWPDIIEPCAASPNGQCQYSSEDNYEACIHCGKLDGVL